MSNASECWICGGSHLWLFKESSFKKAISSEDFNVTDYSYGCTGELRVCPSCGFRQCVDIENVERYYEQLVDREYEDGREARALQAKKILDYIEKFKSEGRLLDIGAASGILLEEAQKKGFESEGIEPSVYFQSVAQERGLNVYQGLFPHKETKGPYDVITLVDVIEHVSDPVGLLSDISDSLDDNGIGVVVTPDVGSLFAKILGKRWWHYRIAHIGYFNKRTLKIALKKAGLEVVDISRPKWYFPVPYLWIRLSSYLPSILRFELPKCFDKWILRANFFDSWMVVFKKK